jgi:hypothetical protein
MSINSKARVFVKRECSARFQFGGQSYDNVPVLNLGPDGCRIEVPLAFVGGMVDDSRLEGLELISQALSMGSTGAKVIWVDSAETTQSGLVQAELQFTDAPSAYRVNVINYVNTMAKAKPQCVAHDLIGMP